MSITLNHSDFQCLQDQLVELKTKNYELAEKNRRGQADFEAAKAKICSLQLQLEEQERDFQVTSTTLRREIESVYNSNNSNNCDSTNKDDEDEDYKARYKKLLHKAKELQLRYMKSVEVVQQMDHQIKILGTKAAKIEEENIKLKQELLEKQERLDMIDEEQRTKLESAIEEFKNTSLSDCQQHIDNLKAIQLERDNLQSIVDRLTSEVKELGQKLQSQTEERRIHERKGLQIVKELKRQLTLEKNRAETLQKRLETALSETLNPQETPLDNVGIDKLSTSSSANGGTTSSNGHGGGGGGDSSRVNNQDTNSVSSWSLVPGQKTTKSTSLELNEALSICSLDSEDRETVQRPCDTRSDSSLQPASTSSPSTSRQDTSITSAGIQSPTRLATGRSGAPNEIAAKYNSNNSIQFQCQDAGAANSATSGMSIEEQAALMERLTRLQHDKWTLEEKLSYMEQANASLTEDLANKSDIIKHYFKELALRSSSIGASSSSKYYDHGNSTSSHGPSMDLANFITSSRRTSLGSVNQLLSEKTSLKKVVDFLKERSQITTANESEITREATRKMQLMLEETLIKCLKLQENLDSVTSELNRLQQR